MFFLHSSVCSQVLCVDKCCVLTSAESESLVLSVYAAYTVRSSLPWKFVLAFLPRGNQRAGGAARASAQGAACSCCPSSPPPEWPSL